MGENEPTTLTRLLSVGSKVRERGWLWLPRRMLDEVRAPGTRPGLWLRPATGLLASLVQSPFRALLRPIARRFSDTLVYFHDLDVVPITFDVLIYLAGAELERQRQGLARIHVVVVPGRYGGLREETPEFELAVGREARLWRLHNLVIPAFGLLPSLAGYTVCVSRAHAGVMHKAARHIAPSGYHVSLPVAPRNRDVFDAARRGESVHFIRTPPEALRMVSAWLAARAKGRRVITITLREYGFMPRRNSNRAAWLRFARELPQERYFPVIVLDTHVALDAPGPDLAGLTVFGEASWNLWLRSALYELAYLNVSSMQGATDLCWYNARSRYLQFVPLDTSPQSSVAYFEKEGYPVGGSFSMATPTQRLVWAPDAYERIVREFEDMCRLIEQTSAPVQLAAAGGAP